MVDYICPSIFSYIVYNPILYRLWLIHHYLSAETVVYRIFYSLNRIGSGHLSLRELKRGNLLSALRHADDEEDINKVLRWYIRIKSKHFSTFLCIYFSVALYDKCSYFRDAQHWTFFLPVGISHMSISMWYIASSGSWTQTTIFWLIKKILLSMETMHWHTGL